jgi:hypothetical protein
MDYHKVTFSHGVIGDGYQIVDAGVMVRLTDLDGNDIDQNQDLIYTAIEPFAAVPAWGTL